MNKEETGLDAGVVTRKESLEAGAKRVAVDGRGRGRRRPEISQHPTCGKCRRLPLQTRGRTGPGDLHQGDKNNSSPPPPQGTTRPHRYTREIKVTLSQSRTQRQTPLPSRAIIKKSRPRPRGLTPPFCATWPGEPQNGGAALGCRATHRAGLAAPVSTAGCSPPPNRNKNEKKQTRE